MVGVGLGLSVLSPTYAQSGTNALPHPTDSMLVPVVDGPWWQIAPNAPDVGRWKTGQENVCDFTIFQSDDSQWHCIACVRGTSHFGQRLLFQWEAAHITNRDWKPVGILEAERGRRGQPLEFTSVQAPHHIKYEGRHYLFYNSAGARCLVGEDGQHWRQHKNVQGQTRFFDMGRDVCVFRDEPGRRWIAYYCGTTTDAQGNRKAAMVARTAPALEGPWSEKESPVLTSGNPESPFVVRWDGRYYLWQQMSVYVSDDPLHFDGAPLVAHLTELWFNGKFAPEVAREGEQWYVAGYSRGLHVAKMKWERRTGEQIAAWREKFRKYLEDEQRKREERERARGKKP
jgi:hypothetical protein